IPNAPAIRNALGLRRRALGHVARVRASPAASAATATATGPTAAAPTPRTTPASATGAVTAAASSPSISPPTRTPSRRRIAAPNLHAAEVANVHVDLFSVVAANLPPHERRVKRGFGLRIGDLHVEMVEEHRPPPGRVKWGLHGRVVARRARVAVPSS